MTAGDLAAYPSAGHLAAAAGLIPVPNDSGRQAGTCTTPRYSRPLRRVLYLSAQTSMMRDGPPSRDYYLKKRQHARTHNQAVIALARRRLDVLWALLRDNRTYTAIPPTHPLDNTIEIPSGLARHGHQPQWAGR